MKPKRKKATLNVMVSIEVEYASESALKEAVKKARDYDKSVGTMCFSVIYGTDTGKFQFKANEIKRGRYRKVEVVKGENT